jgi:hypothetical protein
VLPDLTGLDAYVGSIVVLDTATPLLYLGTLERVHEGFLTLTDVDVQDSSQMNSTKEIYILEARKFGVKKNRHRVEVRGDVVVSISRLDEVIEY